MVNEINKPPGSDHFNERLEASNRQLREMQEEHRQLVQEMTALRERATELKRLSLEREQLQLQQQNLEATAVSHEEPTSSLRADGDNVEKTSLPSPPIDNTGETANQAKTDETDESEDKDSAEYIKQKIEEIAALKAQFKRVQHMVDTTHLIEQHLSSKTALDSTSNEQRTQRNEVTTSASSSTESTEMGSSGSPPQDSKEELLTAMLSMFTNFSDDLRGQAENLRAERERIRGLKELLLQRRKEDS